MYVRTDCLSQQISKPSCAECKTPIIPVGNLTPVTTTKSSGGAYEALGANIWCGKMLGHFQWDRRADLHDKLPALGEGLLSLLHRNVLDGCLQLLLDALVCGLPQHLLK